MKDYQIHALQVTGSGHRLCQDHYRIYRSDDRMILIAADGHGAPSYTRSGLGARIACAAAEAVLKEKAAGNIPAAIKDRYDTMVAKHLALRPLADWELERLKEDPQRAVYGATLLAAVIEPDSTTLYQLGDGEIYALDAGGNFLPELPEDDFCLGTMTTSLSNGRAFVLARFRVRHYPCPAAAVLLFTDGCKGGLPVAATGLTGQAEPREGLEAMIQATCNGDDQTVLLACNGQAVLQESFRTGLRASLAAKAEEARQQKRIAKYREELEQLDCFLLLAARNVKRLRKRCDPQLEEYLLSLKPSFDRFAQLQQLLGGV